MPASFAYLRCVTQHPARGRRRFAAIAFVTLLTLSSAAAARSPVPAQEVEAAQAAVLYDHPSGAYVGGFVSTVRLEPDGATGVQGLGQVGYALRGPGEDRVALKEPRP